ncbi:uncharacterized protein LOC110727009 [Chenopodium quinoa]|uniref:P-loop containing nucleoside triphosphate hydrolases superfamily protein n=1 Tax=Chenopodium quinoa TaxID=63459 RepID=A0A803L234_CHEQI|nr:uncharacterized protein LOC110727009 [Chenopodium quinoa]
MEAARISSLLNMVFSWSLQDVLNKKLYKNKLKKIPDMFSTTTHYLTSFHYPLIEEIRAEFSAGLESVAQSPACEISNLRLSKNYKPPKSLYYEIMTNEIRDVENKGGQYVLQSSDLIALTNVRPQSMEDLIRPPDNMFLFAYVETSNEDEPWIQILSSKEFEPKLRRKKHDRLFATFLMNMTTSLRIWRALNPDPKSTNMGLIQKVLQYDSTVDEDCSLCSHEECLNVEGLNVIDLVGSLGLDESQQNVVVNSIAMRNCSHQSNNVKLIWGPPGTGKTKTVASLLFVLLNLKCRTLTCAPTNIAVVQVANRLVKLFLESNGDFDTYGLGDIVLFGHEERMKIDDHDKLVDVFLDNRRRVLVECLDHPFYGWKPTFKSMTSLLEDPQARYNAYLQELQQRKKKDDDKGDKKSNDEVASEGQEGKNDKVENKKKNKRRGKRKDDKANDTATKIEEFMTFEEFLKNTFYSLTDRLVYCMKSIYTHLPTSSLPLDVAKKMIRLVHLLKTISNERKKVCRFPDHVNLMMKREEILSISSYISHRFPKLKFKGSLRDFCLSNAKLIFCTASSSMKVSKNVEMVIIDEAAQLKECESTIPLQVPGLRNTVLIGDDRQLPAMVQSKALGDLNFGRSLFQRLTKLGKKTHLLNIQYRMHPSISLFPNKEFYKSRIIDSPKVKERSYFRSFLNEDMFGSYSFINVSRGKEDIEKGHSPRNMEEAVVVDRIVAKLFKGRDFTKQKLSVGVISPYKGQVCLIQEKIGKKYANYQENFAVNVRSVDGFQGGEEDIIIISTVRSNRSGSVGFLSNHQRTNVALTRARYCLWIVGNCTTLTRSGSVWKKVVTDAKTRGCFYDADEDFDLTRAKPGALVKTSQSTSKLDFFGSLNLGRAKWKVFFGNSFKVSITSISSNKLQNQVQEILKKIADGWRQSNSEEAVKNVVTRGIAFELLELYKVDEQLYLAWTIDIIKEESEYTQAIKVWDILPASMIPKLAKELDILFKRYTLDFINRRKYKAFEGNLVVPMSWPLHSVLSAENLSDQFSLMNIRDDQEESSSISLRNNLKARSGLDSSLRRRKRTDKAA